MHNYLKIINKINENILWVKIDKRIMKSGRHLLLGTVYISPINSTIHNREDILFNSEDTYDSLYKQISFFDNKDDIMIGGDFNARTGNLKDFIENEKNENTFIPLPEYFTNEVFTKLLISLVMN